MRFLPLVVLCFLLSPSLSISQDDMERNLTINPYLGQKLPTKNAEIFAPGLISTEEKEALYGIFNHGGHIIFDRTPKGFKDYENYPVYSYQEINGVWEGPTLTTNLGKPWYFDYPNPKNGQELCYTWWLPLDENGAITSIDLWKVKYDEGQWNQPEKLPYPINTEYVEAWPSMSSDGTLYFFSTRKDGFGKGDLYKSTPVNGKYVSVKNLGSTINTPNLEHDPVISSDGHFLIFSAEGQDSMGKDDLYITFKTKNGTWTKPKNLGHRINSEASENRPYLTPDEKYLFFTSTRNGNLDIFWVSTEIIEEFAPKF